MYYVLGVIAYCYFIHLAGKFCGFNQLERDDDEGL